MDVRTNHLVADINNVEPALRHRYSPIPAHLMDDANDALDGNQETVVNPNKQRALAQWAAKKRAESRRRAKASRAARKRSRAVSVTKHLFRFLVSRVALRRPADFVIGGDDPYLLRWYLIPRNRFGNIYLHRFCRSDDDRALHDHPWWWCSLLLGGEYTEHTIDAGGIHRRRIYRAGSVRMRGGRHAHRIELHAGPVWTLFVTGPRFREWGFHCPIQGWIPWQRFTAPGDSGRTGPGCEG